MGENFLRERLPPCQKEILDHALKENLITLTIRCQIKVFRKDEEGKFKSVLVKSKKQKTTSSKWRDRRQTMISKKRIQRLAVKTNNTKK